MSEGKLRKVCDIELAGEKYELAKNGKGALVRRTKLDAYGRPYAEEVNLRHWMAVIEGGLYALNEERAQALLDALVDAMDALSRARTMNAGGEEAS